MIKSLTTSGFIELFKLLYSSSLAKKSNQLRASLETATTIINRKAEFETARRSLGNLDLSSVHRPGEIRKIAQNRVITLLCSLFLPYTEKGLRALYLYTRAGEPGYIRAADATPLLTRFFARMYGDNEEARVSRGKNLRAKKVCSCIGTVLQVYRYASGEEGWTLISARISVGWDRFPRGHPTTCVCVCVLHIELRFDSCVR